MEIKEYTSAKSISPTWDNHTNSIYQKLEFLLHLEKYNPCKQRYYVCVDNEEKVLAGAVVYSLKINLFTFSKKSFPIPFAVIGLPASVDAAGIVGKDEKCTNDLISTVLKQEKGLLLCLNYNALDALEKIIKLQTLPTLLFEKRTDSWDDFLSSIKHNYRRRILKAEEKISAVERRVEPCSNFYTRALPSILGDSGANQDKIRNSVFRFFPKFARDISANFSLSRK